VRRRFVLGRIREPGRQKVATGKILTLRLIDGSWEEVNVKGFEIGKRLAQTAVSSIVPMLEELGEVHMQSVFVGSTSDTGTSGSGGQADEYLCVELGGEEFGIRMSRVLEIVGVQGIVSVSQGSAPAKGIVKLRDKSIRIIELREKLGLPASEYSQRTCMIVVEVQGQPPGTLVGMVVDGVIEVVKLASADIEDTADVRSGTPYTSGMTRCKGKPKILLDIENLIARQESWFPESSFEPDRLADSERSSG
jgi:purine-binding chemotaxis protein CheW